MFPSGTIRGARGTGILGARGLWLGTRPGLARGTLGGRVAVLGTALSRPALQHEPSSSWL